MASVIAAETGGAALFVPFDSILIPQVGMRRAIFSGAYVRTSGRLTRAFDRRRQRATARL